MFPALEGGFFTTEPPENLLKQFLKKKKKKKPTTFCIATLFPKVTVRNNFKQKFISSQIWRLENQSQGVNRIVLLLELFMEGASLPLPVSGVIKNLDIPWFTDAMLQSLPPSSHGVFSCVSCFHFVSSLYVCV